MSEPLPREIRNAYWFQAFNAISWQTALGSPMLLFATQLGASATTIGLLTGMAPLMAMLQLPVSRFADEIGYRRLMLTGWGTRVFMLIFLALLPFGRHFLPDATLVNLLLAIMFLFTMLRGLAGCAWLPWITSIVPEASRGVYLGRERTFINSASVVALGLSGAILAGKAGMASYAFMFFVSFAGGFLSLRYLNRIPEPPPRPAHEKSRDARVDWREIFRDVPFRRLLAFSVAVHFALCANGSFILVFMREKLAFQDGRIIWLTAGAALLGMCALNLFGRWMDRLGSKPWLGLVWTWWIPYLALWFLVSTHSMTNLPLAAVLLMLSSGISGSIFELALTRLLLNTVGDRPGKAQYFAVYGVSVSLVLGLVPVAWGMLLDSLLKWQGTVAGFEVNRFSVFFAGEICLLLGVAFFLSRLHETKSQHAGFMVYEIFVGMPTRGITLLLQRFR